MRLSVSVAALAVALASFASGAAAQAIGSVGASYTRGERDVFGTSFDNDFYALEGAVKFGSATIGGALDGSVTYNKGDGYDDTAMAATLHANARFGEGGLVGFFGGVDRSDYVRIWGAGVEGQANIGDNLILYVQGGYGRSRDILIDSADVWAGRADIRYLINDNIKLQASGGYQHAKDSFIKTEAWIAGIEGEYQFSGTPFSLVASYQHYAVDDIDLDTNLFRIGGRYTFGGTLRQRERSGANLGSVQRLFSFDQLR